MKDQFFTDYTGNLPDVEAERAYMKRGQLHASIEWARQAGTRNLEYFNVGLLAERYGKQDDFAQAVSLLCS